MSPIHQLINTGEYIASDVSRTRLFTRLKQLYTDDKRDTMIALIGLKTTRFNDDYYNDHFDDDRLNDQQPMSHEHQYSLL